MKKNSLLLAGLALTFVFGFDSQTTAQKKTTTNTPVTSGIADSYFDTTAGTTVNYRIQSDSTISASTTYYNGVDSVLSILQSGNDWELDTRNSPNRRVSIDFRDAAEPGTTPPFTQPTLVPARFVTKCYLYGTVRIGNMIGLNSTLRCPIHVNFNYNSNTYRIDMNESWNPGTNDSLVTCTGVVDPSNPATSKCNSWRIEPSGTHNGETKNIAQLVRIYTSKGKTVEESRGKFFITFNISITNP